MGQLLGPEQHDQHDRDEQYLPRAVEKVTDHVCSLQPVAALVRPRRRARPRTGWRSAAEIELAVAAHAVRRVDGGSAPVAPLVGWAPHTLLLSHLPGWVGPQSRMCSPVAWQARRTAGLECWPGAHTGGIGRRGRDREDWCESQRDGLASGRRVEEKASLPRIMQEHLVDAFHQALPGPGRIEGVNTPRLACQRMDPAQRVGWPGSRARMARYLSSLAGTR